MLHYSPLLAIPLDRFTGPITSDHTYQAMTAVFEYPDGREAFRLKGGSWNLGFLATDVNDQVEPKRLFANNPWNCLETPTQFLDRKAVQLEQLFKLLVDGNFDYFLLQEVDFFTTDFSDPRYGFTPAEIERWKEMNDYARICLEVMGFGMTMSTDIPAATHPHNGKNLEVNQKALMMLYKKAKLELDVSPANNLGHGSGAFGYVEKKGDKEVYSFKAYQNNFSVIEGNMFFPTTIVNKHLDFVQNFEKDIPEFQAQKTAAGRCTVGGGDYNHVAGIEVRNAIPNSLKATNISYVSDEKGKIKKPDNGNKTTLTEKHPDPRSALSAVGKCYDLFSFSPTKNLRVRVFAEACEHVVRKDDGKLYLERTEAAGELCCSEVGKPAVSPVEQLPEIRALENHIKRTREELAAIRFLEGTPGFKKEQRDDRGNVMNDLDKKALLVADLTQLRMVYGMLEGDEDSTAQNLAYIPEDKFIDVLKLVFVQGNIDVAKLNDILDRSPLSSAHKIDILGTLGSLNLGFNHPNPFGGWRSRKEPYTVEEMTRMTICAVCQLLGRYLKEHRQEAVHFVRDVRPVDGPRLVQQTQPGVPAIAQEARSPAAQESFGATVMLGQENLPPEFSSMKRALKTIRLKYPEAFKIEVAKRQPGHRGLEDEVLKISFANMQATKEFAETSDLRNNYNAAIYPVTSYEVTVAGEFVQNLMDSFGMQEHGTGGNTMWEALKYAATPPSQRPASTVDLSIDPAKRRILQAISKAGYQDVESVTLNSAIDLVLGFKDAQAARNLAENMAAFQVGIQPSVSGNNVHIPRNQAQLFLELMNVPNHGSDKMPMYAKLKNVVAAELVLSAIKAIHPDAEAVKMEIIAGGKIEFGFKSPQAAQRLAVKMKFLQSTRNETVLSVPADRVTVFLDQISDKMLASGGEWAVGLITKLCADLLEKENLQQRSVYEPARLFGALAPQPSSAPPQPSPSSPHQQIHQARK